MKPIDLSKHTHAIHRKPRSNTSFSFFMILRFLLEHCPMLSLGIMSTFHILNIEVQAGQTSVRGPGSASERVSWVLSTLPLLTPPRDQSWRKSSKCSGNPVTAEVPRRLVLGFTHHILCCSGSQAQSPPCCPTFAGRLCYAFHARCPAR